MKNKVLEEIYNDASLPGSLSGLQNFYRVLQKIKIKIKRQEVKNWLTTQEVYTRHKPLVKNFQCNQVVTRGIDDLWQIVLADLQKIAKYNDNYRYLVTCIDVFSKFAWIVPIKIRNLKPFSKHLNQLSLLQSENQIFYNRIKELSS